MAAPRHMAKKKSFRSAPRIVRGRESERCTRLIRADVCHVFLRTRGEELIAGKEPSQEIHGGDGHSNAEQHASEYALGTAFAKGEGEAGDNDRDKREAAGDGAGESGLKNADGVLPRRVAGSLCERRRGDEKRNKETIAVRAGRNW